FHQAFSEIVHRVFESLFHSETRKVRTAVGQKSRLRVNGVLQGGDVGVTAKNLGIFSDQVIIQFFQKLIAVVAADGGQNSLYLRIGKGFVQVFQAGVRGGGAKAVHLFRMFGYGDPKTKRFQ